MAAHTFQISSSAPASNGAPLPLLPPSVQGILSGLYSAEELPEERVVRISNLMLHVTNNSEKKVDPSQFFAKFKISEMSRFQEVHVEALYDMIERHPIGDGICLHDVFGMELLRLLKEMETVFGISKTFQEDWQVFYLLGYIGILYKSHSLFDSNKFKISNIKFYELAVYNQKITEFTKHLKIELTNKKKYKQSQQAAKHQATQQFFETKCQRLTDEWDKTRSLLMRCLLHPQGNHLLAGETLNKLPGTESLVAKDISEIFDVLDNLSHYTQLIIGCIETPFKKKIISSYPAGLPDILRAIFTLTSTNDLNEVYRISKEIFSIIMKILPDISDQYSIMQSEIKDAVEGKLNYPVWCSAQGIRVDQQIDDERFLEFLTQNQLFMTLVNSWLLDIKGALEYSVISLLEPNFHLTYSYINRIALNAHGWISQIVAKGQKDKKITSLFDILEIEAVNRLSSNQTIELIGNLLSLTHMGDTALPKILEYLKAILPLLKNETELFLEAFAAMENFCPGHIKGVSLLNETKWFAQLYILIHDMEVVLGMKEGEHEAIFPEVYLEFLALENKFLIEKPLEEERLKGQMALPLAASVEELQPQIPTPFSRSEESSTLKPAVLLNKEEAASPQEDLSQLFQKIKKRASKSKSGQEKSKQKTSIVEQRQTEEQVLLSVGLSPIVYHKKQDIRLLLTSLQLTSVTTTGEVRTVLKELGYTRIPTERKELGNLLFSWGFIPLRNRGKGSHTVWEHPITKVSVTVPKPKDDTFGDGLASNILQDALNSFLQCA